MHIINICKHSAGILTLFILCNSYTYAKKSHKISHTKNEEQYIIKTYNKLIIPWAVNSLKGKVKKIIKYEIKPNTTNSNPVHFRKLAFHYNQNMNLIQREDIDKENNKTLNIALQYNEKAQIKEKNVQYFKPAKRYLYSFSYNELLLEGVKGGWFKPELMNMSFEFNRENSKQIIEIIIRFGNGNMAERRRFLGPGRLKTHEFFDYKSGKLIRKILFTYDVFGRLSKRKYFEGGKILRKFHKFTYNDAGSMIQMDERTYHGSYGSFDFHYKYDYDDMGNIINKKKFQHMPDKSIRLVHITKFEYEYYPN